MKYQYYRQGKPVSPQFATFGETFHWFVDNCKDVVNEDPEYFMNWDGYQTWICDGESVEIRRIAETDEEQQLIDEDKFFEDETFSMIEDPEDYQ